MKKYFLLSIINVLLFGIVFSQQQSSDKAVSIFQKIHEKLLSSLPTSFSGELKSKAIQKNLNNIPKDSYLNKNEKVFVELNYSKKNGPSFIVKNVDEFYKDMYKNLPRQIFAFDLLLSKSENNLLAKYDIVLDSETTDYAILRLNVKNSDNRLVLYVDKKLDRVLRVDYEIGKDIMNSTIIMYTEIDKFVIPTKFISKTFKKQDSNLPEIYEIDKIQIK